MFHETVTSTDGSTAEGTCSEAHARRLLGIAVRRGYSAEVLPSGGVNITRKIPGAGSRTVKLTPVRKAGKLTPTVRTDLALIASRHRSDFVPETGRIKAGYVNSIPPGASALLMAAETTMPSCAIS